MVRVGQGFDVHRLVPGRDLVLGGVRVEHPLGLEGHSDADVLLHAVIDAMLGACAKGDIGAWFPPGDERYRGADSRALLTLVREALAAGHWHVGNLDATVVAEEPKMAPHIDAMRNTIADLLNIAPDLVSIKATTSEGLGFAGRGEGIAAMAVVLMVQNQPKDPLP
jgi:2-C-methyl-D-erythritol 2,4-cyclodiphosphate synthase